MATELIGYQAILDLQKFNSSYNSYIKKSGALVLTTDKTTNSIGKSYLGLGDSLWKVAGILSGAVVAGATVAGIALGKMSIDAVKNAADLEQGIANIAAVLNMTKDEAGFLKGVIIDLGLDPRLKVTTFEAAEAIELLAKQGIFAGLSLKEMEETALGAGTAVVMLANATGADFGQAANIAGTAMAVFNLEADKMTDIVSGITSVTTNSKFTIDDYEVAMRNGGAAVAEFGLSLDDFNTMVAASAEELGTGMKAGTGLLNFMNRLTPNTEKATNVLKDLGIITQDGTNRFFDMNGELKNATEISKILNEALYGTQKVVSEVSNRTSEQNALLQDLNAEYNDAQQTIEDYTTGVDGLLATEEEKNKAIENAQSIIDKIAPSMQELNDIDSDYITTLQTLTTEQRAVALETVFGNDALKTAIALGKEGAVTQADFTAVMDAYGVSAETAFGMISSGLTEFELLQQQMSKTDAIENAETRMDTLKGTIEKISGVVEGLSISFGDKLLPVIDGVGQRLLTFWEENKDTLLPLLENLGEAVGTFAQSLLDGEKPIASFSTFLNDIEQGDLATKFENLVQSIKDFVDPIKEFVSEHSVAFEGALKAIGIALGGAMIASAVAAALGLLVSPITLIIGLAGLLGAAWETNFGGIQEKTTEVVNSVKSLLDDIGITELIDTLSNAFSSDGLDGLGKELPNALGKLGKDIGKSVQDWFSGIDWVEVGTTVREGLFTAMENLGSMAGTGINFFANWLSGIDWNEVGNTMFDLLIGAFVGLMVVNATIVEAIFNFFKGVITTVDWATLGQSLLDMFTGLYSGLNEGRDTLIQTLYQLFLDGFTSADEAIDEWFMSLDSKLDAWVNNHITEPISNALTTFAENLSDDLTTWWTAFNEWVQGITWEDIGYWITTAILNVFIGLPFLLVTTLAEWWNTFWTWVTTTDWESIGNDVNTRIDTALKEFGTLVLTTLAEWWTTFTTWFTETDWESLAEKVKKGLKDKLERFWEEDGKPTFDAIWTSIQAWFTETDWSTLGKDIIDGLIDGIGSKLEAAKLAILGVANGVQDAWNDFWSISSPSKLMVESGQFIMEGATIGVLEGASELMSAMGFAGAGAKSSFVDSARNILPNAQIPTGSNSNVETTNSYEVNNSFAGNPQITDADQLKLTLAGFN